MIKDLIADNGIFYHEFSGDVPRPNLAVIMHGFPGRNKHLDLAEEVYRAGNHDVVVPHNLGIGKTQGEFTFLRSLQWPIEFIREWQFSNYRKISLIGLSWGGLISLNAFREIILEKRGKLVLVCPFSRFQESSREKKLVEDFMGEVPELFIGKSFEEVWEDLQEVKASYDPRLALKEKPYREEQISVIHGSQDEQVPLEDSLRLAELLGENIEVTVLEDDHKFTHNRDLMIHTVLSALKT